MRTDYSAERGNPTIPQCGNLTLRLKFDGKTLTMWGGSKVYSYPAKSGNQFNAPIPKGQYWVNPSELWTCGILKQINFLMQGVTCNSSGWGNYRLTIHPYAATNTHNRGGFFIHGGTHDGSAGCINLGLGIDDFVNDMRSELGQRTACFMPLEVA